MKPFRKIIISFMTLQMLFTHFPTSFTVNAEEADTEDICMVNESAASENDAYAQQLIAEVQASSTATASLKFTYYQDTARSILDMVNEFRTGSDTWVWNSSDTQKIYYTNLKSLYYDYELEKCAMQRAAEIALSFSHTRPDGTNYSTVYPSIFGTHVYGENIAMGYRSAEIVFERWREDDYSYSGQGHRRNMLNPNVCAIGIACAVVNGYPYWVQEFSSKRVGITPVSYDSSERNVTITIKSANGSLTSIFSDAAYETSPQMTLEIDYPVATPKVSSEFRYRGSAVNANITVSTSSSNTGVVKIENGKLIGVSPGDALITYKIQCGSYTVTKKLKVHCQYHEHDYYFTWDWADDYSAATGTYVCIKDQSHTGTLEAQVSMETTEPSCYQDGAIIYTASAILDGQEYTGERIIAIPATGDHDYDEPVYEWAEDHGSVTASVHCANGGEELTETAIPVYEVITEPEEGTSGIGRLCAEFENEIFETQYLEIEIPPLTDTAMTSISFDPENIYVPYTESQQLTPQYEPAGADTDSIIWTSSDPSVVSVDSHGNVKALTPGVATITAYTLNGLSAECYVFSLFTDVKDTSRYYFDPVYFCAYYGITVGHGGAGKFSPNAVCTREQIVTFLWRLMGCPEPETFSNFSDVKQSAWYYKPVTWAYENGITTGLNDGTGRFGVGQPCTREQCVTFLYRAAGNPNPNGYRFFYDVSSDKYYYNAVMWAAAYGITTGLNDGSGCFGVGQSCTRAMIVTFLFRYVYYY